MFADLGCHVLDADSITRTLFEAGQAVNRAVAAAFGPSVVAPDGSINRQVLGELVFNNPSLREKLNSLVHPAILERQDAFLASVARNDPAGVAIIEAALMIEVGSYKKYDKVVVVTCTPEVQRRRLAERSHLTPQQIDARIAAQMPLAEKVKFADFVVDNSGDFESTRQQVAEIHRKLTA
jgi:dephospho-CoA kinase